METVTKKVEASKEPVKKQKACKKCEGDKMIQSENGDSPIICPRCEGTGLERSYWGY